MEKIIRRLKTIGEHEIAEAVQRLYDERNQAVDDLHGLCHVCVYDNHKACDNCIHTARIFEEYGTADNWEWRGIDHGCNRTHVS